jgi:putative transposase
MSRPQKFVVHLTATQLTQLTDLTQRGTGSARVMTRARILLLSHAGHVNTAIRDALNVSLTTVINVRRKWSAQGLDEALYDAPRPGRPAKFDGKDRAAITSLACSKAPKGYAQWSLRLLADRAVELQLVEEIAHSSVFYILKKTKLPHTANGSGVSRR